MELKDIVNEYLYVLMKPCEIRESLKLNSMLVYTESTNN